MTRELPSEVKFESTTFVSKLNGYNDYCREETIQNISIQKEQSNFLVSIVIPLYNEEKSIGEIINKIPDHNWIEIVVVNDGSLDNSKDEVNKCERDIKLINHHKNKGYGEAVLNGIKSAKGDIIITLDSDGQHNPNEIYTLIKPILDNKADITVGSRYLGKCNYNIPFHTRFGESLVEKFLYILFRQKIGNNQSGYRAFKRKTIDIFNRIKFKDFTIATEVLFKAGLKGYRLLEVPIILEPREYGYSKVSLIKTAFKIFSCMGYYLLLKLKTIINKKIPF